MVAICVQDFRKGIGVLLRNYHVLNGNIFDTILVLAIEIRCGILKTISREQFFQNLKNISNHADGYHLELKLLLKHNKMDANISVTIDLIENSYLSIFENGSFDDFFVCTKDGLLIISPNSDSNTSSKCLLNRLKPKLLSWCTKTSSCKVRSLELVDSLEYRNVYSNLKKKYGSSLLELWEKSGECTDSKKYIYEDLAITAYLICLWKGYKYKPQSFADLGCGNGLLVYLLNEEGYNGYGYDIRARKIWMFYPKSVRLYETCIDPISFVLPLGVDWLIGNHSDELSLWLPVLGSSLSYSANYFLLPCCPYEFSGKKFQRRNSSLSTYQDFIQYCEYVSNRCGYDTKIDRLKIPSTKRIALIGVGRTYSDLHFESRRKDILEFVRQECPPNSCKPDATQEMVIRFRNKVEPVRNCTRIPKMCIDSITLKIFLVLLSACISKTETWLSGGSMTIKQIAQFLRTDDLKRTKSEFGGIKTLLRNRHEVFKIENNAIVSIRKPEKTNMRRLDRLKTKQCFFYEYHPQGCPLQKNDCSFIH